MAPQDAQAGGMERIGPDGGGGFFISQRGLQALAQLARGLVGERDRDDLPRLCRMHGAQPLRVFPIFRLGGGQVFSEEQQVLLGGACRRIGAVQPLAKAQDIDDAVDEHGGFAATRARKDKQRPLGGKYRLALLFVQGRKALLYNGAPYGRVLQVEFGRFHRFPRFMMEIQNQYSIKTEGKQMFPFRPCGSAAG